MIGPLFNFWGRNSSNFSVGILENWRHQKVILKLTNLYYSAVRLAACYTGNYDFMRYPQIEFFHWYFSIWPVEKENKLLSRPKKFFFLSICQLEIMNHYKYQLEKFVDSEFEIGETIWWIFHWIRKVDIEKKETFLKKHSNI